jgi:hypothetical protein
MRLPRSIEEVTPQWVSAALSLSYPGTEVTRLTFGSAVRATGTKQRLLLEYNDAGHAHRLPATMWFKGGLEPHSDHVRTSHVRESLYYERVAPLNLVNGPTGYFAAADEDGHGAQLIEDLLQRNARFGTALQPLSPDTAAQALEMLASLHAYWWRAPELDLLGTPGGSLATDGIILRLLTPEAWDAAMERPAAAILDEAFRNVGAVRAGMDALWAVDRTSQGLCMVHGDAHPGNLFFEQDGRPGFLDWQRLMQCDWAHDVNYLLVSSMSVADSEAHEQELLRLYLDARTAKGVPAMDWDAAWLSYRQHTMYGLIWNVVPPTMQPIEVCEEVAARFNAAAARHRVGEALFGPGGPPAG